MREEELTALLERFQQKQVSIEEVVRFVNGRPSSCLTYATLDGQRQHRTGVPEVVYGEHKTVEQLIGIFEKMLQGTSVVLGTRVDPEKAAEICATFPQVTYHAQAHMLSALEEKISPEVGRGVIQVVTAGTSDIPVAEEAYMTLRLLGHPVQKQYDVGVAGIHRLFEHMDELRSASVIIAVAGMEGALPSVVAGMVECPVVAVPTSVGYGVGAGGIAPLLGMLNSCAPGVAVVNIDNGFGAACMAVAINKNSN